MDGNVTSKENFERNDFMNDTDDTIIPISSENIEDVQENAEDEAPIISDSNEVLALTSSPNKKRKRGAGEKNSRRYIISYALLILTEIFCSGFLNVFK